MKVTMNVSDELMAFITLYAAEHLITRTEAFRRAISTLKWANDTEKAGNKVVVYNPARDEYREIRWL